MPKPHPREFRDDVVAVARKGEEPIAPLAKDFSISESCLGSARRQCGEGAESVVLGLSYLSI